MNGGKDRVIEEQFRRCFACGIHAGLGTRTSINGNVVADQLCGG